jgi:hypothetical protein
MYQCAVIDEISKQCTTWVQVGFLGLPDISISDACLISVAMSTPIAIAWCIRFCLDFAKNA